MLQTTSTLKSITRIRLREAKTLYRARLYQGAYHCSGFAVECALKAVVASHTRANSFPDRRRANAVHTHSLAELLRLADLANEMNDAPGDVQLNWAIVKDWDNEARYDSSLDDNKATDFYVAVTNRRDGVMSWVRRYW